jgi:hypothetical protein
MRPASLEAWRDIEAAFSELARRLLRRLPPPLRHHGPERGFMTDQHAQAAEAIRESRDFWLSEHPGTLSEIVTEAVTRRTCIHDIV